MKRSSSSWFFSIFSPKQSFSDYLLLWIQICKINCSGNTIYANAGSVYTDSFNKLLSASKEKKGIERIMEGYVNYLKIAQSLSRFLQCIMMDPLIQVHFLLKKSRKCISKILTSLHLFGSLKLEHSLNYPTIFNSLISLRLSIYLLTSSRNMPFKRLNC